jgi:hypothetical protein
MKKIWAAIKHLKEDKVDIDTFETKIYEIEKELEGEEDVIEKLQGELKKGPKRQKSSYGVNITSESFEKLDNCVALL